MQDILSYETVKGAPQLHVHKVLHVVVDVHNAGTVCIVWYGRAFDVLSSMEWRCESMGARACSNTCTRAPALEHQEEVVVFYLM